MLTATNPKPKDELLASNSWVDVRDVALGHVLALERPAAGGERIVVAGGERAMSLIYYSRAADIGQCAGLQGHTSGRNGVSHLGTSALIPLADRAANSRRRQLITRRPAAWASA